MAGTVSPHWTFIKVGPCSYTELCWTTIVIFWQLITFYSYCLIENKVSKKFLKTMFLWTSRSLWAQRKTVILVCKFLFRTWILFVSPTLLLVHRSAVFKIFYLYIFTDKEPLDVIILPIIWFLKFFSLSQTRTQFVPALCSFLPPSRHFFLG